MKHYDLIVIGGGAAGQMAAISAKRHHPQLNIALIDRTFALGRKILVCGAGRCNITNINLGESIESHYYGATQEFITDVFEQFGYSEIVKFFNELGIELYVERKTDIGKMFPITNQAKTVTSLLLDELERNGIDIFLNTHCNSIHKDSDFVISASKIDQNNQPTESMTFTADKLIISAGGRTYPALGSNGTGYDLAASLGHQIIDPVPSALPVVGKSDLSHYLQGLKLEIEATSVIDGKVVKASSDDVMFTQYGLSGPAILNISREISIHFNREHKNNAAIILNFFPGQTRSQVETILKDRWQKRPDQRIEFSLYGIFPDKVALALVKAADLQPEKLSQDLSSDEIGRLVDILTGYKIELSGTRGWNEAEFTAGGVNTAELKAHSLESLKVPGLYFCGEILDVDGDVGGYNLSWAWSSGYVAGKLQLS